ncbi:MAG: hypothetical protein RLY72_90 [Planctomycetota bacterium]
MSNTEPLAGASLATAFHRLLALEPIARRQALRDLAQEDQAMAEHLGSLLESHASAETFLDGTVGEALSAQGDDDPLALQAALPEKIGEYRVLRELGRGGTSIVLLGEREHPNRRVAIKCLLQRRVTPALRARFDAEQELLAQLHHPGIVSLLDCGSMLIDGEEGVESRPWFAMEFVEGEPLSAWLQGGARSHAEKLRVFETMVAAVAHAHARGIIHADLKPANILMDSSGCIRVLDFGAAHSATALRDADQTFITPRYASPEALRGDARDICRRSDVYSLGLLGLELFSNRAPSPTGARCIVDILQRGSDALPRLRTIAPRVSRELEVILQRALASDPTQRYADAVEFSEDLSRLREHLPIRAIQPTISYSLRCAVRRNPVVFAALALLLLSMTTAIVLVSLSRQEAHQSHLTAQLEASAAAREAARAERMLAFLTDVLSANHPGGLGKDVTVGDAVTEAAARIDAELASDPLAAALMHLSIAETFIALADVKDARIHFERARALPRTQTNSANYSPRDLLGVERRAVVGLAQCQLMEGELTGFDLAIKYFWKTDGANADHAQLDGATAIVDEPLVRALELSAKRQLRSDDPEAAIITLRRALAHASSLDNPRLAEDIRNGLGAALAVAGRLDEAASELEPIVAARRSRLGDAHPSLGAAIHNLASLRRRQGQIEQSIELLREELRVYAKCFDAGHPLISEAHNSLGTALRQANRTDDALAEYLLASDPDHRADPGRRAAVLLNLGSAQAALAHETDALVNYDLALQIYEDLPNSERARAAALWTRAGLLHKLGRGAEATTDWRECLSLRDGLKNVDTMLIVAPLIALAEWESTSGDKAAAAAYTARALKLADSAPSISAEQRTRLRLLNALAE